MLWCKMFAFCNSHLLDFFLYSTHPQTRRWHLLDVLSYFSHFSVLLWPLPGCNCCGGFSISSRFMWLGFWSGFAFDIFSCQVRVNISSRYICVGPMVEPARLYDKCKRVFSIFPLFYLRSAIGWNLWGYRYCSFQYFLCLICVGFSGGTCQVWGPPLLRLRGRVLFHSHLWSIHPAKLYLYLYSPCFCYKAGHRLILLRFSYRCL